MPSLRGSRYRIASHLGSQEFAVADSKEIAPPPVWDPAMAKRRDKVPLSAKTVNEFVEWVGSAAMANVEAVRRSIAEACDDEIDYLDDIHIFHRTDVPISAALDARTEGNAILAQKFQSADVPDRFAEAVLMCGAAG